MIIYLWLEGFISNVDTGSFIFRQEKSTLSMNKEACVNRASVEEWPTVNKTILTK